MAESSVSIPAASYKVKPLAEIKAWAGGALKRAFDFSVALLGLILLSPIFAWIAHKIRRDSPGPALYYGARLGRDGRVFQIIKFRTMHENAASYQGPPITGRDDQRITPFGHWLRTTKLNELPQLINVLRGDMSLVGPRPEHPDIQLPDEARHEILSVRPGITSPASVLYRNEEAMLAGADPMNTYLESIVPSKLRLDQLYVRRRSFWLDLDILFWTVLVLIPYVGRIAPPEALLFYGPISQFVRKHVSWFLIDALTTFSAMGLTALLWRSSGPLHVGWPRALLLAVGFTAIFSLVGAMVGAHQTRWAQAGLADAISLLPAGAAAALLALVANGLMSLAGPSLPDGLVLTASATACLGFVAVRYRGRLFDAIGGQWLRLRSRPVDVMEKALIVGAGESGQFAAWLLSTGQAAEAYHVVGYIDDALELQGMRIRGFSVVGRREDIVRLVKEKDIGLLVFAIHRIHPAARSQLLELCAQTQARLIMLPDLAGLIAGNELSLPAVQANPVAYESWGGVIWDAPAADDCAELSLEERLQRIEQAAVSGNLETVQAEIRALRARRVM